MLHMKSRVVVLALALALGAEAARADGNLDRYGSAQVAVMCPGQDGGAPYECGSATAPLVTMPESTDGGPQVVQSLPPLGDSSKSLFSPDAGPDWCTTAISASGAYTVTCEVDARIRTNYLSDAGTLATDLDMFLLAGSVGQFRAQPIADGGTLVCVHQYGSLLDAGTGGQGGVVLTPLQ